MRTILFRGKRTDDSRWVKGYYIHLHKTTVCCSPDPPDNDVHQIVFEEMTDWNLPNKWLRADVDPETVGQFTGLNDSEFHSIFEGDIVRMLEDSRCFEIRYDAGEFCFYRDDTWYDRLDSYSARSCIILGNIHDNPELLKEDNDDA